MRTEPPGPPRPVTIDPDRPAYQVTFWGRVDGPADVPEEQRTFRASEWKVFDADVPEVLAWAKEQAGPDRSYVVYVAAPEEDGQSELVRLYGQDPTIPVVDDNEGVFRLVGD